jgi:hypothetical protein
LHLKTIRAAGQITFKGYGRAATAITPLDASRLVVTSAGSIFAKDSVDVLTRFAKLVPISGRTRRTETLEESLAQRIAELPIDVPLPEHVSPSPEWQQRFGSRRLAETTLQLLDAIPTNNKKIDRLPRFAILRWLNDRGHSTVLVLVRRGPQSTEAPRDSRPAQPVLRPLPVSGEDRQETGPDRHRQSAAMTRSSLMVSLG